MICTDTDNYVNVLSTIKKEKKRKKISMQTIKQLLIFRFFHYIWFIDSEHLCFILILKEKITKL